MLLCFGTYANILKKCSVPGTTNRSLVSTLVATIDPNNKYGDKNNDTPVSRLMGCERNFPMTSVDSSSGPVRTIDGPQTNVIALSRSVSPSQVVDNFDPVMELLAEDKKIAAVGAMHHLIESDETIEKEHRSVFVKCLGDTAANVITAERVDLKSLLARLFLYTVLLNNNTEGKSYLNEIRKSDFIDRFSTYAIFLQNMSRSSETIVPAIPNGERLYMKKLTEKYDCLPTILHKEAFSPFKDFYVPNDVEWHERIPDQKYSYYNRRVSDVTLTKLTDVSRFIVLSGTGGLGKSMMMRNLALSAARDYDAIGKIPLFVTLKDYEISYATLDDYVFDMIHNLWEGLTPEGLIALLSTGKALLLFDGLDEIPTKSLTFFTKQLNAFIDRFSNNTFIISSRPYSNFQTFTRFTVMYLKPFTLKQALDLVDRFNYRADAPKLQLRFRSLLETKLYYSHIGFSDNPLLLSIMMLTFEMDADVPTVKYVFFQEAYAVLSKRHDASKDGYTRKMKTGWTSDEFAKYFSYFCAKTYSAGKISFTYSDMEKYCSDMFSKYGLSSVSTDEFIYDALNSLCIMYQDGMNYGFIHRSFQEYFCAKFFHNQLDENLRYVIPIFDCKETTKKDDTALPMLFDMKPQAVEKYLILPYLEQFLAECENNDGLWTFLEAIYPDYEIADGDAFADDDSQIPNSNLYAFILEHYDIPLMSVIPDQIEDIIYQEAEKMVYREDTDESVWANELPFDYEDNYGEPEVTGRVYRFDWNDICTSRYCHNLKASIEAPDSPFVHEYNSIKKLLEELRIKTAEKKIVNDPFAHMF